MVGVTPDSKPLVLIVEDENLVRFSAVAMVEEAGYEAISASDADEAIHILDLEVDPTSGPYLPTFRCPAPWTACGWSGP